ncbi:MAG: single-stranded DNA-binding protein [Ruminococcus sp.]|nr:single-stranded DNA-binding protein [Ruminococcus sp.]MCM1478497.1 single-stranded DNA-binding protein [Muribaculaceae bacterium]
MLNACSINKVILMGRLTSDPELRQTPNGISTCRFTVAVDGGTNQNTNERRTDFITVNAWRSTAEFVCKYFTKGRLILVEGSLRTGSYTDRNHSDVTHYTCDVTAENVSFGETKSSSQGGGNYAPQQFAQPRQSSPQPAPAQQETAPSVAYGDFDGFNVIGGDDDGDLPF